MKYKINYLRVYRKRKVWQLTRGKKYEMRKNPLKHDINIGI